MIEPHRNFSDAWLWLLYQIYNFGSPVSSRGYETHEILGVQLRVTDLTKNILVHPIRNLSYRFAVAEWLWIAAGREDVATIGRYNRHLAQFSDDGVNFAGAYGKRLAPQIDYLLEQLKKPGSRQAVASIWTPSPAASKDIPCTMTWQLLARDGKLHAIVNMRSSDVWLGIPYDFYNFSQLTNSLSGELGLLPGSLTFNLGSSHLYDRDREKAQKVLDQSDLLGALSSPWLPSRPPADDIFNFEELLMSPWSIYRDALQAHTNADALACLKELSK